MDVDGLRGTLVSGMAHPIDETTARDHGNEHSLRPLTGIESGGATQDVVENFLHGVFGIGLVARQAARDRPNQPAELIDTVACGNGVALRDSRKQGGGRLLSAPSDTSRSHRIVARQRNQGNMRRRK